MALITCKNLSLGYDSNIVAQNLSFEVNKGDYLCVVGENGSGKTTLMKTLLGLIPPISGEIVFGDGLKKDQIGYLPQQTLVQRDFPASVLEVVLSGFIGSMGFSPFYNYLHKKTAIENLAKICMQDFQNRCYRELSGGQQQRVLLARALCATEKIILLDEPVSGLDINAANEMYSIIRNLNESGGITVIMISHDVPAAKAFASHILHIGRNSFFGTKSEYLNSTVSDVFSGGETK